MPTPLPSLSAKALVYPRPADGGLPSADYTKHIQQYATSSRIGDHWMQPAYVVYPSTLEDVVAVVNHARKEKVAIAVRSGGHAFGGQSSTFGPNIQVDINHCEPCRTWNFDVENNRVTFGTAFQLGEVDERLAADSERIRLASGGGARNVAFLNHGACATVGVGGHLNSGGFSLYSRSFGLFIDQIRAFTIVTADGEVRRVVQPSDDRPDEENDALWRGVLGGSPGSFGVVLDVTAEPFWDSDFPESRAYMQVYPYTGDGSADFIRDTLLYMGRMADEGDWSADYGLAMTFGSADPKYIRGFDSSFVSTLKAWWLIAGDLFRQTLGQWANAMEIKREDAPDSTLWRWMDSLAKRLVSGNAAFAATFFPVIVVQATWMNVSGDASDYDPERVGSFFAHLDAIADRTMGSGLKQRLLRKAMRIIDPADATPISRIQRCFTFTGTREYDLPYMKRTFAGYSTDMTTKRAGFATYAADMIRENYSYARTTRNPGDEWNGLAAIAAWEYLGGEESVMWTNSSKAGTYKPARLLQLYWTTDGFYDPEHPGARERLRALQDTNERELVGHPDAVFSERDMRDMHAPFDARQKDGRVGAVPIDELKEFYFESDDHYQRVLDAKRMLDPHDVFTPNPFCIGASRIYTVGDDGAVEIRRAAAGNASGSERPYAATSKSPDEATA